MFVVPAKSSCVIVRTLLEHQWISKNNRTDKPQFDKPEAFWIIKWNSHAKSTGLCLWVQPIVEAGHLSWFGTCLDREADSVGTGPLFCLFSSASHCRISNSSVVASTNVSAVTWFSASLRLCYYPQLLFLKHSRLTILFIDTAKGTIQPLVWKLMPGPLTFTSLCLCLHIFYYFWECTSVYGVPNIK